MKKIEHKGRILKEEFKVSATPQQAWEAWAQPERVKDWFVDDATGEPTPGSQMRWVWARYGMDCPVKVLEAVPAERLVLEWPMPEGGALLWEIDVRREGGKTTVKIVSSGFGEGAAWDEQYEGQKHGWPICVAIYKAYVERHFGRRRRDVVVMRPLEGAPELYPFFKERELLSRWLTREGELGAAGRALRLVLKDGRTWTGSVLVDSGRELCFSCAEIGGLVTLKALGGCGAAAKMLVLHASGWELSEGAAAQLKGVLESSVDELLKLAAVPAPSR